MAGKRDSRYFNRQVLGRKDYQVPKGTIRETSFRVKDMSYRQGSEGWYDIGTIMFLNVMASLNKWSPSLTTILLGQWNRKNA